LFQLYPLPKTGPSVLVSMGVGADGNATQSGSGDVIASGPEQDLASAYVSGLLDLGLVLRTSRRSTIGLSYSGVLLALLDPSVDDLSLQVHELVARAEWAPSTSAHRAKATRNGSAWFSSRFGLGRSAFIDVLHGAPAWREHRFGDEPERLRRRLRRRRGQIWRNDDKCAAAIAACGTGP